MNESKAGLGYQDFEEVRTKHIFYIDKTDFIREWWEYAGRSDLFEGLSIWEQKSPDGEYRYRKLQGTFPVIFMSFANVKATSYKEMIFKITKFSGLFNSTFKTNEYLERGLITGITRGAKESIFTGMNNLDVVTTTSDKYATCFGFTEEEVFTVLDDAGLGEQKQKVKRWYD